MDQWEAEGTFPAHKIFKLLGSAGFLGVNKPVGKSVRLLTSEILVSEVFINTLMGDAVAWRLAPHNNSLPRRVDRSCCCGTGHEIAHRNESRCLFGHLYLC